MKIDLTKEEITDLLNMINGATFQGQYAEKVVTLKKKFQEIIDKETENESGSKR